MDIAEEEEEEEEEFNFSSLILGQLDFAPSENFRTLGETSLRLIHCPRATPLNIFRSPSAPDFIAPPRHSVKSSSVLEPPDSHLPRTQRAHLSETDSVISSVSMKSASSMYEPPSFNLKRKQSQLTEEISSCSVCLEAVKDPVRLLCGHWSCKLCVLSFRDQNGLTADYSCKKCGKGTETDQDLQSVLLEKKIKRCEMETEKLQAEKETFQAEKEKFQAEKETFELKKRKLALEIQLLEQKGSYTNNNQGVVFSTTRIPYI